MRSSTLSFLCAPAHTSLSLALSPSAAERPSATLLLAHPFIHPSLFSLYLLPTTTTPTQLAYNECLLHVEARSL